MIQWQVAATEQRRMTSFFLFSFFFGKIISQNKIVTYCCFKYIVLCFMYLDYGLRCKKETEIE